MPVICPQSAPCQPPCRHLRPPSDLQRAPGRRLFRSAAGLGRVLQFRGLPPPCPQADACRLHTAFPTPARGVEKPVHRLGQDRGKRPTWWPQGCRPAGEVPADRRPCTTPRLPDIEIFFLFFWGRGLTAAPPGKTIMGWVVGSGGQSSAGETGTAHPPWSWAFGPTVDPPAFDAGSASAEHGQAQVPRPPSEVAHPVSSAALRLSWALSTQLTTLGSCGEGTHLAPGRLSAVARLHRRYFGMRRNPPSRPSDRHFSIFT